MVATTKSTLVRLLFLGITCLLIRSSDGFIPTLSPCIPFTSPKLWIQIDSLKRSPRPSQTKDRHFASTTKLAGKRSKSYLPSGKRLQIPSILRCLPFSENSQRESIETGLVETALALGNKKRRAQWTREASRSFSWIPPTMLSTCIDGLASAFAAVAPKDLKDALKPGGLEKVRSKIETVVVRDLKAQPIIKSLPMPRDDKNKLVEYLVDLSLDFFLKDLESTLAAPSVKLAALDRERHEIMQYMSFREMLWYRLKYKPMATMMRGLLSLWTVAITAYCVMIRIGIPNSVPFLVGDFVRWISSASRSWLKI